MNAALLVLGMHRSGTSALTRVLSLLGAELPRNLMPGVEGSNPLGHWESQDLMTIHEGLLASAGSFWHDVTAFPADWHRSPLADQFRERILECLEQDHRGAPLFVIKDPRVCRFVPFWLELLDRFGAVPHVILPVRNPLEVAASLKRRDGFSIAKGAMLWLRHVLDAEHDSRASRRSLVTYDALLDDWGTVTAKISQDLGLVWPRGPYRAAAEIEEFLSSAHRHQRATRQSLHSHSQIVAWVERAYDALLELCAADEPAARDRLDALRDELAVAERAFGPLLAEAHLSLERSEAQRRAGDAAHQGRIAELEATLRMRDASLAEYECAFQAERNRSAAATQRIAELEAIEAKSKEVIDTLQRSVPTTPAEPDRPGRRWWRHLPVPATLKARLKPPARRVLERLGMRPTHDRAA